MVRLVVVAVDIVSHANETFNLFSQQTQRKEEQQEYDEHSLIEEERGIEQKKR